MWAVLKTNDPPCLFRRGRELIKIARDGSAVAVDATRLTGMMDRAARICKMSRSGEIQPARISKDVAISALTNLDEYGFPAFREVIHTPTMVADGRIIDAPYRSAAVEH